MSLLGINIFVPRVAFTKATMARTVSKTIYMIQNWIHCFRTCIKTMNCVFRDYMFVTEFVFYVCISFSFACTYIFLFFLSSVCNYISRSHVDSR